MRVKQCVLLLTSDHYIEVKIEELPLISFTAVMSHCPAHLPRSFWQHCSALRALSSYCRIAQDSRLYYKPIVWQHQLFLVFYLWFQYFIDFLKCEMSNIKSNWFIQKEYLGNKKFQMGATDRDRYSRVMINFHSIIAHVQTVLGTLSRPCNAQHQYQSIPNRDYRPNAWSQWIN